MRVRATPSALDDCQSALRAGRCTGWDQTGYRLSRCSDIRVYPGFPTPFWGLSGFFVGDLIGKASVGARGKRTAFSKARWARSVRPRRRQLPQGPSVRDKMAPREGAMRDVELDPPRPRTAVDRRTTMFASTPSTCTRRTLDLPRKDWDIRYLRYLGNSDIARYTTLGNQQLQGRILKIGMYRNVLLMPRHSQALLRRAIVEGVTRHEPPRRLGARPYQVTAQIGAGGMGRSTARARSSRQSCNPAGGSPAVSIVRVGHEAMPHPGAGNEPGDAWCKRPGRPARDVCCGGCSLEV